MVYGSQSLAVGQYTGWIPRSQLTILTFLPSCMGATSCIWGTSSHPSDRPTCRCWCSSTCTYRQIGSRIRLCMARIAYGGLVHFAAIAQLVRLTLHRRSCMLSSPRRHRTGRGRLEHRRLHRRLRQAHRLKDPLHHVPVWRQPANISMQNSHRIV